MKKPDISSSARVLFFITVLILNSCSGNQQSNSPERISVLKEADFKNPPADTRPGVYWYWINEFISKVGYDDYKQSFAQKCTPEFSVFWIEKIKKQRIWIKNQL